MHEKQAVISYSSDYINNEDLELNNFYSIASIDVFVSKKLTDKIR